MKEENEQKNTGAKTSGTKADDTAGRPTMQPASASSPGVDGVSSQSAGDMHRQIEMLAYQLWEQGGCRPDSAEEDWLEAEIMLIRGGSQRH